VACLTIDITLTMKNQTNYLTLINPNIMKSIILICAAVIITSGAYATSNTTNNLSASSGTSQNALAKSNLSSASYHAGNNSHSKYRRHLLKELFTNPFHKGNLNRSSH